MESKRQEQLIREFYAQLTPVQLVGAKIAAKMLGSSYIVEKTKGYLHWLKNVRQHKQEQDQEQQNN
jgi:hypothetical protein